MSQKVLFRGYSGCYGWFRAEGAFWAFFAYVNRLSHFLHLRNGRRPSVVVLRCPLATVSLDLQYTHFMGLPRDMISPPKKRGHGAL